MFFSLSVSYSNTRLSLSYDVPHDYRCQQRQLLYTTKLPGNISKNELSENYQYSKNEFSKIYQYSQNKLRGNYWYSETDFSKTYQYSKNEPSKTY
jgi:hypothetical protein